MLSHPAGQHSLRRRSWVGLPSQELSSLDVGRSLGLCLRCKDLSHTASPYSQGQQQFLQYSPAEFEGKRRKANCHKFKWFIFLSIHSKLVTIHNHTEPCLSWWKAHSLFVQMKKAITLTLTWGQQGQRSWGSRQDMAKQIIFDRNVTWGFPPQTGAQRGAQRATDNESSRGCCNLGWPQVYRPLGSPAFRAEHVNLGIKHRS